MAGKSNGSKVAAAAAATTTAVDDDKAVQGVTDTPQAGQPVAAAVDLVAIESTHIRVRAVPREGFRRAGRSFGQEWTEIDLNELDEVQVDQLLTERNLVCEFLVKDAAEAEA